MKLLDNKAAIKTHSPDFIHFSITGLDQLMDVYGVASPQFTDALDLLKTVSQRVSYLLFILYLNVVNDNVKCAKQLQEDVQFH